MIGLYTFINMKRLFQPFKKYIEPIRKIYNKYPILKTLSTVPPAVFIGDFLCQKVNINYWKTQTEIDYERTFRMALISLTISAPLSHVINYSIEGFFPGNSWKNTSKKFLIQSLTSPFTLAIFFAANTYLQKNKTIDDALTKVKNDVLPTYLIGSLYWPFIGIANLKFVPLTYRPLVGSLASIFWNIFMSNRAN